MTFVFRVNLKQISLFCSVQHSVSAPNFALSSDNPYKEFYVNSTEDSSSSSSSGSSNLGDLEETYSSALFHTEPLYQFYDVGSFTVSSSERNLTFSAPLIVQVADVLKHTLSKHTLGK